MQASSGNSPDSRTLPWTRSCLVCGDANPRGFHLTSRVENGLVVLEYKTRETDLGYRQIVHGGIAMTLLDEVMTWAAIIESGGMCVAAELTFRLRGTIKAGQAIRVEGKVMQRKSRLVLTEGLILDEDGQPLVTAAGKYLPMPQEHVALCCDDFVAGSGTIDPAELMWGNKRRPSE